MSRHEPDPGVPGPRGRFFSPIEAFFKLETASGLVLLLATIAALAWSNLGTGYESAWHHLVTIGFPGIALTKPVILWINDFLMAIFFLLVGLELKREMVSGELSTLRQALAPVGAAVGGMVVPAVLFLLLVGDPTERRGWAVPMATDIAFALGCLRALGRRVPASLIVFLTSVAVVDDLGAIVVIALFHTAGLSAGALGTAVALTLLLLLLNQLDVRRPGMYVLIGMPLWVAVLKSGVHATLAGVIVGLSVPARKTNHDAPAERLEHALHPWVAFVIIPLFALANAGVTIDATALGTLADPLALGIVIGLFVGKQVGVTGGCWLVVRSGLASLPSGLGWLQIYGAALLAGIGFTMALFIAALSFGAGSLLYAQAKVAIVAGSLVSSFVGVFVLVTVASPRERVSSSGE